MRQPVGPLLVVAAVGVAAWLIAAAAIRLARRPRVPDAGPPTMELRPEPPAVAGMLASDFQVTRDAVPATLLDLAARGAVEIDQLGEDTYVSLRDGGLDLLPYEERVLNHVRALGSGRLPAAALTTGPADSSRGWWSRFRKEVLAEARRRGLCRPVWDARVTAGLWAALLAIGLLFWASVRFDFETVEATPLFVATLVGVVAAAVVAAALVVSDRQRDTALGREAAAHWLGFREHHEANEVIPTLPPAAVVVRGRYLAYCAALGQAAGAVRALPLGAEDDERAWTDYGGRWRQVRVRYPRPAPGLGPVAVGRGGRRARGHLRRRKRRAGGGRPARVEDPDLADFVQSLQRGGNVLLVVGALGLLWFGAELVMGMADLVGGDRRVVGEVVRRRDKPGFEVNPPRHRGGRTWYVAVDTGAGDRIAAWSVTQAIHDQCFQGREVVATVTRRLHHVRAVDPPL